MESIYLVSLIVGGFFVALSLLGGESDSDADVDVGTDADLDVDTNVDIDMDADVDLDVEADTDLDADSQIDLAAHADGGVGLVDLLTIRFLFLFAAFFGLTGTLLRWFGSTEPITAIASILTGIVVGLGGNYFIKTIGYREVSSALTSDDLIGRTAHVQIPFRGDERGKVRIVSSGQQLSLVAAAVDDRPENEFEPGDEVVVVRMNGSVAEVIKPE
jgi:membrane protein implicated in regulation of membrane protease activity